MDIQYLQTTRTGRVATLGNPGPHVRHVWLVFHGYRQLATNFVKKFEPLQTEDSWILAPEGLSRFYVEGYTGKVGASWMTREDRLDEIKDQQVWLARVMEYIEGEVDMAKANLHILAFSQGVATAWRWLVQGDVRPESFVIYAGRAPQEDYEVMKEKMVGTHVLMTYGDQDQFAQFFAIDKELEMLREVFPQMEYFSFEGKHQVLPKPLEEIKYRIL